MCFVGRIAFAFRLFMLTENGTAHKKAGYHRHGGTLPFMR